MNGKRHFHMSASQKIMAGFAVMILAGAFLLNLPIASKDGRSIGFVNALFTATSANCVTGLVVVNTAEHWTVFGKVVLLILIQLGGLGFMTALTLGMILLRRKISLRSRLAIQASFNQDDLGGMVRLVKTVVRITLVIELLGAVLLSILFFIYGIGETGAIAETVSNGSQASFLKVIGYGLFHSVSAFCNAGFDIIGDGSLTPYRDHLIFNFVIMGLIVAGGLGFTVWDELIRSYEKRRTYSLRIRIRRLSLHSKIVLLMTLALTVFGSLLFLLLEWSNPQTLGDLSIPNKGLAALFQSVTLRTAGFNTISQEGLTEISKFFSCIFMLIGGSSAGTAGGMKTVTVGIILISMYSVLKDRSRIEALGRSISVDLLQKALTVVATMLIVVFFSTLLLHFTEMNNPYPHSFLDLLFETCSAAGTVGVTSGLTPHLSIFGRMVIIVCMFLGRLGPITVVLALNRRGGTSIRLPEERVIIG